jgi:hypothetical protein
MGDMQKMLGIELTIDDHELEDAPAIAVASKFGM